MRRPLLAAVAATAALVSGCALGDPKPATDITSVSATLNGDVYSSFAGDTRYWFEYGETATYSNATPERTIPIADDQAHPVEEPIGELSPNTTYHFRLCAADEEEDPPRLVCSTDRTFATGSAGGLRQVAFASQGDSDEEIFGASLDGTGLLNLTNHPAEDRDPDWSADGGTIVFSSDRDGSTDIHSMDAATGVTTRLTTSTPPTSALRPAIAGDGRIAYQSNSDHEAGEVYVMDADGGNAGRLTENLSFDGQPAWSPDGTKIAFTSDRDGGAFDVYVMDADGANPIRLTDDEAPDSEPTWSYDGTQIAFTSERDGHAQIYVMDADGSDETNLSNDPRNDRSPDWNSPYDRILFERNGDEFGEIWVMDPDGSDQSAVTNREGTSIFDFDPTWGVTI